MKARSAASALLDSRTGRLLLTGCTEPAIAPHLLRPLRTKKVGEYRRDRDRRHACRHAPGSGAPRSCTGVTVANTAAKRRRLDRFVVLAAPLLPSPARALPSSLAQPYSPRPASLEAAAAAVAHGGRLRQVRRRGNERLPTSTPSCVRLNPPPRRRRHSRIWPPRFSQVLEAFGVDQTKGLSDSQVLN